MLWYSICLKAEFTLKAETLIYTKGMIVIFQTCQCVIFSIYESVYFFPTVLCQLLQAYLAQNAAEGVELKMAKLVIAHGSSSLCVCQCIHCQVSDRFLFVHKSYPVISSIFETIKQQRENGWFGNPWILICQHNEIERGRWWRVRRVGSGCRRA